MDKTNSTFEWIYGLWTIILSGLIGLLHLSKYREDENQKEFRKNNTEEHAALWKQKAGQDIMDIVLEELRESRKERKEEIRELRELIIMKHSQKRGGDA